MTSGKEKLENDTNTLCVSEFVDNALLFVTFKENRWLKINNVYYYKIISKTIDLASIARLTDKLHRNLDTAKDMSLVYAPFTFDRDPNRLKSAFLMGVYALCHLQMKPVEIFNKLGFTTIESALMDKTPFNIELVDYLRALRKAIRVGLVNFQDFNDKEYDDLFDHRIWWIVPQKLLVVALADVEFQLQYMIENGVNTVVRLDNMEYADKYHFPGIEHCVFSCIDGKTPSLKVVEQFLELTDKSSGTTAICFKIERDYETCLALAYLVKHYRMTTQEAYAWIHLCIPPADFKYGDHHYQWLEDIEDYLWYLGDTSSLRRFGAPNRVQYHKYGVYSKASAELSAEEAAAYVLLQESADEIKPQHDAAVPTEAAAPPQAMEVV